MMQTLVGIVVALVGAAMVFDRSWVFGVPCLVFGLAIINGARHEAWVSLDFGGSDRQDGDGDGGGDGGGGD